MAPKQKQLRQSLWVRAMELNIGGLHRTDGVPSTVTMASGVAKTEPLALRASQEYAPWSVGWASGQIRVPRPSTLEGRDVT